jgi:Flp pilus assembly pilin Flp
MANGIYRSFWFDDEGQDLVEVTLLLALVVLTTAAIVVGLGQTVNTVFTIAGDRVEAAAAGGTPVVGDSTGGTTGGTATSGTATSGTATSGTASNGNGNGKGNGKN